MIRDNTALRETPSARNPYLVLLQMTNTRISPNFSPRISKTKPETTISEVTLVRLTLKILAHTNVPRTWACAHIFHVDFWKNWSIELPFPRVPASSSSDDYKSKGADKKHVGNTKARKNLTTPIPNHNFLRNLTWLPQLPLYYMLICSTIWATEPQQLVAKVGWRLKTTSIEW